VRDPRRARHLEAVGVELWEGDVLEDETLRGAGEGVEVAYYLVHSMGRGAGGDFAARERTAAEHFARMAADEDIARVVYLGGLGGDRARSRHLRSRHETAETLRALVPPLTYFRAAMVVGAGSESLRTLRYLVERLPAMIAPRWLDTETQPVGIDDVVAYLAQAPAVARSAGVRSRSAVPTSSRTATCSTAWRSRSAGGRDRSCPCPCCRRGCPSLWIGLVTPVDAGVARPLVEGLSTPTAVTDPSGAALFDVDPRPLGDALEAAIAEEPLRRAVAEERSAV
jgi:hypothetical protein